MAVTEMIPNVVAMALSGAALVLLRTVQGKLGGGVGSMLRWIVLGVFLSVFLHASVELSQALNILSADTTLVIMGLLLSVGSVCFCVAGVVGSRALS